LISGRADVIISDGKDLYVVDIKSMNSMIFKSLQEPKEENVKQLQLYLHFFKVSKGILLYINKDTQELKEFMIDYDSKQANRLLKELSNLKKKIESNVIPPRLSDYPVNWQCRYCQYRDVCDMAGEGNLNWENFKRKLMKKEQA
jgi:CRISPR/Cas system-associated exonuclease Cas4 (RecB family)